MGWPAGIYLTRRAHVLMRKMGGLGGGCRWWNLRLWAGSWTGCIYKTCCLWGKEAAGWKEEPVGRRRDGAQRVLSVSTEAMSREPVPEAQVRECQGTQGVPSSED